MRKNDGFTILELMIVIAIIAIIVAIAIPSLASAKRSSNESAAIGNLRAIASAQEQYRTRFGRYCARWDDFRNHGFLAGFDGEQSSDYGSSYNIGGKQGYTYILSSISGIPWRAWAVPNEVGVTGERYFYVDASGVIRWRVGGLPGPSHPPID